MVIAQIHWIQILQLQANKHLQIHLELFLGDGLRIVPWDSSPCFTTIWVRIFSDLNFQALSFQQESKLQASELGPTGLHMAQRKKGYKVGPVTSYTWSYNSYK